MKIYFFKNESHFHPRISYTFENAELIRMDDKIQNLKKCSTWLFMLPLLIFTFVFLKDLGSNVTILIAIWIFGLPAHELCHALFCWITGRAVERICFFPYKRVSSVPVAYVKTAFGVWNRIQVLLFSSFPLILLSLLPALLAVFIPPLRMWLIFLSLYNLSISSLDIIDIICLLKLPKNCLDFGDIILTAKGADKPIIIHQLSVTPKLDKIDHICFQYANNELTEIDPAPESSEVITLKQEFIKQFNFES